ncbi:MAG: C39 family peptidase [Chloroflexia bacterium]|nr:C39 family peptidase [Chloroflexia bacterium]
MIPSTHHRTRSIGSGVPLTRRGMLRLSAGAGLALAGPSTLVRNGAAQRMDPFTYITAMEATTDLGQVVGQPASDTGPTFADNRAWDAYIQVPIKAGQDFSYTCEFDSSWIVLTAYGQQMTLDEQLDIVGHDLSFEPYWEETASGFVIYGGDIEEKYSGDYRENLLARARTTAVRKVFDAVELSVTETPGRASTETALLAGQPVFFKSTVDMLDWDPTTWLCPDGDEFPVVLTNDHALVLMGFNDEDVIVRDPLGPTTTNEIRPWQYRVSWDRYLDVIASQGNDAIAIGPGEPKSDGTGGAEYNP